MRIGRSLPWFLSVGAILVTPAVADEVVYFTNGTYLLVTTHQVEKEMISVDLGGNSKMAFPLQMVDKIESAGRSVYLNPTYYPANQAVAGSVGGQVSNQGLYPVSGAGAVPSRLRTPYPSTGTGVPANGGLDAQQAVGYNPGGYRSAPGEDVADRSAAEMRAFQGGVPIPQAPQSLSGPAGRKASLVRMSQRPGITPVYPPPPTDPPNGGGTPPSQNPVTDPPADPPSQNPPPGE